MKTCSNCGAELGDKAAYCQTCGVAQGAAKNGPTSTPSESGQQLSISRTAFYTLMIALALMGMAVVGLVARGPSVVTQTQINYATQTQFQPITYTAAYTQTQAYTVTMASFTSRSGSPPPAWFTGQYCGYPFDPYICNEGPPVTITGYLTNSSGCVNLYVTTNENYVVWNLPQTYPDGSYQVYGFVYPNWPQTEPFPPYPFQRTLCIGIPIWSVAPYIQTY